MVSATEVGGGVVTSVDEIEGEEQLLSARTNPTGDSVLLVGEDVSSLSLPPLRFPFSSLTVESGARRLSTSKSLRPLRSDVK